MKQKTSKIPHTGSEKLPVLKGEELKKRIVALSMLSVTPKEIQAFIQYFYNVKPTLSLISRYKKLDWKSVL
jgi:hypothetical protein